MQDLELMHGIHLKMQAKEVRTLIDQSFSLQWCRENVVVPLGISRDKDTGKEYLTIAVGNFTYLATIGEWVKKRVERSGLQCQFVEKPPEEIQGLLDAAAQERIISGETLESYEFTDDAVLEALKAADSESGEDGFNFEFDDSEEIVAEEDAEDLSIEMLGSQIQKAAAQILIHSCRSNVSDIHVEPRQEEYKVRVRRDGVMQNYVSMPRSAGIKLTACLKNMAKMDIAERRASQDGKILRSFEGQNMEFRCSTSPAKHGEKMVLRILNSNLADVSLELLINDAVVRELFRKIINETNGIVIVSGPTGSGKSTTLASALREKDNGELNIVTAEDPIEYDLGGNIQQFPVLRAKGQTFANLLRTFLRQDPDVILIGETRDPETAECAMDAAETGHLIFTALHANSCAQTVRRLQLMEIPPQKLYSQTKAILNQVLVRKVCPNCSSESPISEPASQLFGMKGGQIVKRASCLTSEQKRAKASEGTLCLRCGGSGYQGRLAVYELAILSDVVLDSLSTTASVAEISQVLLDSGMKTKWSCAVEHVEKGLTTLEEICRILDGPCSPSEDKPEDHYLSTL